MKRYFLVSPNGADSVEVLEGKESDVELYLTAGWRLSGMALGEVANSQVEDYPTVEDSLRTDEDMAWPAPGIIDLLADKGKRGKK